MSEDADTIILDEEIILVITKVTAVADHSIIGMCEMLEPAPGFSLLEKLLPLQNVDS